MVISVKTKQALYDVENKKSRNKLKKLISTIGYQAKKLRINNPEKSNQKKCYLEAIASSLYDNNQQDNKNVQNVWRLLMRHIGPPSRKKLTEHFF